jgi:YfiH family protein
VTVPFLDAAALPVRHGFFTRLGGVSEGPYASLNCSFSSRDAAASVAQNRARAATALDAPPDALLGLQQVHGIEVVTVTEPWPSGAGPRADAMVTARRDVALGIVTADCAPVLLADAEAGVIGAVHAGWRGAVAGVLEATVAAMRALGATSIVAAIGPCIAQKSYEVAADLRDAVVASGGSNARFFVPGRPDRWQFDLAGYCAARLGQAGVAETAWVATDTAGDAEKFFSHRHRTLNGGGPIGHQISVITSTLR